VKEAVVFVAIYHIYKMQLLAKNSNVKESRYKQKRSVCSHH